MAFSELSSQFLSNSLHAAYLQPRISTKRVKFVAGDSSRIMDRIHQVDSILAMTSASLVFLTGLNLDLARIYFPKQFGFFFGFNAVFIALVLLAVPVAMLRQSWFLRELVWFLTGLLLCYQIFMLGYAGISSVLSELGVLSPIIEYLLAVWFLPVLFIVICKWQKLAANAYLMRLGSPREEDKFQPHSILENWILQVDFLFLPLAIGSVFVSAILSIPYVLGFFFGKLPLC